jgi:hypothetical protein
MEELPEMREKQNESGQIHNIHYATMYPRNLSSGHHEASLVYEAGLLIHY